MDNIFYSILENLVVPNKQPSLPMPERKKRKKKHNKKEKQIEHLEIKVEELHNQINMKTDFLGEQIRTINNIFFHQDYILPLKPVGKPMKKGKN